MQTDCHPTPGWRGKQCQKSSFWQLVEGGISSRQGVLEDQHRAEGVCWERSEGNHESKETLNLPLFLFCNFLYDCRVLGPFLAKVLAGGTGEPSLGFACLKRSQDPSSHYIVSYFIPCLTYACPFNIYIVSVLETGSSGHCYIVSVPVLCLLICYHGTCGSVYCHPG